jgi:ApbE superfamily uncharacterized protein (UPF0280 family)
MGIDPLIELTATDPHRQTQTLIYNCQARMHQDRTYRHRVHCDRLTAFEVIVKETDLLVCADKNLENITREIILRYRGYLEAYIESHPAFAVTLKPWRMGGPAPKIIGDMARAGEKVGVGPMAAVAGAIAQYVGLELLFHTREVIVENGGDVFLKTDQPMVIGIYSGRSPFSLKIGLQIDSRTAPVAVCTSSGTVGHSLSLGKADAVCAVSDSCLLADAAATSIGNRIQSKKDIKTAIDAGRRIEGIKGLAVIIDDDIGLWGDLNVVPLQRKKG